ncbi:MFS transporter [Pectobacterium carotovorum]|uniref:MFS transporter n=1 Tax=Pectobacterium carotovorum TaxID=554 RepID=UPI001EFB9934|nr:MFS transporter [Pectobacterium carotovorum]ULS51318.1 MFS transporter [Pectobacterium carotovorum]
MTSLSFPSAKIWLQLLAACLTGLLIPLCFTGPAVVLPAIGQELGGSPAQLSWIMNAYILSYGGAMMVSGSLTDIYGRRRIWLIGLAWFCVFTFAIPFSPSVLWIDLLRLLQGLGGAAMSSLAPLFAGRARARAFSLLGTTFGLGLAFGPLVSGWMVEASSWQGIFYATGIVGLLGWGLVAISTRQVRETNAGAMDWPGMISFTLALGLFTYGMLLVPELGWRNATVIAMLLASVAVFVGFVVIERRVVQPMLDLSFFRSPGFIGVQVLAASPAFLFIVLIVMLPGRFIGIDGYSALQAGQMMVWLAAPLLVVPFLAALLTRWFTPGLLCCVGLFLVAGGLLGLAHGFAQGGAALPLPLLLIGIGIGLPWGLMDALAVSVVTPERVGMATGIFNTVRVSADGVAIAMMSALLATLIQNGMALEMWESVSQAALLEAASRTALGELHTAVSILPGYEALLSQRYAESFISVMYVLAGIAALTACAVFVLLREQPADASTEQQT